MDEQKIKRVISASVAIAVFLLTILLSFMIYQMLMIGERQRMLDENAERIEQLKRENEQTNDRIELWLSTWKIEEAAREKGWYYDKEK